MFGSRCLLSASLLALIVIGCRAQAPSPTASIDRRIEVQIRSQFNVPPDYDLSFGGKTKSDIPDFDNLPVTFTHSGHQTTVTFLISKDGNTLARLEKFDISKNPQSIYSVDKRPVRGNPDAKVTVVNYDDLECPYCARLHEELFPDTLDHYKGLVRFVYKDYPLVDIHPWAMHASIDANCLSDQSNDAYWKFVDYAHSHGQEIGGNRQDPKESFQVLDKTTHQIGEQSKLNLQKLDQCVAKQDESAVRAQMHEGEKLGIEGTPQLYVDGERVAQGAQPTNNVWDAIDRALKADGITPPERTAAASPQQAPQPAQPATATPSGPSR